MRSNGTSFTHSSYVTFKIHVSPGYGRTHANVFGPTAQVQRWNRKCDILDKISSLTSMNSICSRRVDTRKTVAANETRAIVIIETKDAGRKRVSKHFHRYDLEILISRVGRTELNNRCVAKSTWSIFELLLNYYRIVSYIFDETREYET